MLNLVGGVTKLLKKPTKLPRFYCYHKFLNQSHNDLSKNHSEAYSTQMVPVNPSGVRSNMGIFQLRLLHFSHFQVNMVIGILNAIEISPLVIQLCRAQICKHKTSAFTTLRGWVKRAPRTLNPGPLSLPSPPPPSFRKIVKKNSLCFMPPLSALADHQTVITALPPSVHLQV